MSAITEFLDTIPTTIAHSERTYGFTGRLGTLDTGKLCADYSHRFPNGVEQHLWSNAEGMYDDWAAKPLT